MKELTFVEACRLLPSRDEHSAKWAFGRTLLCCGSRNMPGAALLSACAVLRSGTGLTVLASVPSVLSAVTVSAPACVQCALPESEEGMVSAEGIPALMRECLQATAVLCGCGMGRSTDGRSIVRTLIERVESTLILDADALNLLAEDPDMLKCAAGNVILTPHARELARLCGTAGDAEQFAHRYGVTVLCKGSISTVVTPAGASWVLNAPNSGMAKGGSGDVLAGLTAGLAAQGCAPSDAAALAAYVHARAGAIAREQFGVRAMRPDDILNAIGKAFLEMDEGVLPNHS